MFFFDNTILNQLNSTCVFTASHFLITMLINLNFISYIPVSGPIKLINSKALQVVRTDSDEIPF